MLGDPSRKAIVLPAITLEPEQVDFALSAAVGVDLQSFNPMALRQQSEINGNAKPDSQIPAHDEEEDAPEVALPVQITQLTSQPSHGGQISTHAENEPIVNTIDACGPHAFNACGFRPQQQLILSFTPQPIQSTSSITMELVHPAKKPKLSAPGKRKGRTCALCEHAKCASAEIGAGCSKDEFSEDSCCQKQNKATCLRMKDQKGKAMDGMKMRAQATEIVGLVMHRHVEGLSASLREPILLVIYYLYFSTVMDRIQFMLPHEAVYQRGPRSTHKCILLDSGIDAEVTFWRSIGQVSIILHVTILQRFYSEILLEIGGKLPL
ncbi:hypothetical protein B0H19DRAFT_1082304 [Mycena capillaripes]|nr:hypothetical protein B0H19DRAFT_1082304 [Mycena capillaripes]